MKTLEINNNKLTGTIPSSIEYYDQLMQFINYHLKLILLRIILLVLILNFGILMLFVLLIVVIYQ